jgi:hypothetical protein
VGSSDSLGQQLKNNEEAIPQDACNLFKFWMLKIWEFYKPYLLNIVCAVYLSSPDPIIILLWLFLQNSRIAIQKTGLLVIN